MGIFSRKRKATSSSSFPTHAFIGRKFMSDSDVDRCLETFALAASRCYDVSGELFDVEWRTPSNAESVESAQGSTRRVSPARFVAQDLSNGERLYLAAWDDGLKREMWFVPPRYDGSPIQLAGVWSGMNSLTSTGSVESAFWGGP